jgi:hypothetical protein
MSFVFEFKDIFASLLNFRLLIALRDLVGGIFGHVASFSVSAVLHNSLLLTHLANLL